MTNTISDIQVLSFEDRRECLKSVISDLLVTMKVKPLNLDNYIPDIELRNDTIRQEYNQARAEGQKAEYLKYLLSKKYELSEKTIQAIVHKRR